MRRGAHAVFLLALGASGAASCRKAEPAMPPPSTDPALARIDRPLPTIPAEPLAAETPNPHGLVAATSNPRGLVAAMLTKVATTPAPLDWVPAAVSPAPTGRIVWARDFADGYRRSVGLNKGMVVVFGSPGGEWYEKVVASFASPEIAALADQAVWIRADPTTEVMAKNVCNALGVEHTPTISVLDPDPEMISEEARIEGYEEPARLARDLDVPLQRANGKLPRVPTMRRP
ncbi:MAG TPA: hypothetical protein VGH97_09290 [Thermoanaerobaculia bacterium]|jgi:hypothetical protein